MRASCVFRYSRSVSVSVWGCSPGPVRARRPPAKSPHCRGARPTRWWCSSPSGGWTRLGDARTPEGSYVLDYRLEDSDFYKAIHISYPNETDRARARALDVDPGGRIMIHGLPKDWSAIQLGHPELDWTQGCIAVTNRQIEEILVLVDDGTPIEIYP